MCVSQHNDDFNKLLIKNVSILKQQQSSDAFETMIKTTFESECKTH
jgi:hypothetical protein